MTVTTDPVLHEVPLAKRRRRARGEVPALILRAIAAAEPGARFTPYALAHQVGVPAGSATAAVKRLIAQRKVRCYGESPLIIGAWSTEGNGE